MAATQAQIIDDYFREKDYYPHVPYAPIGEILVDEVERMGPDGLYLSTACALVEQESGGKNLFGCDWGPKWTDVPPYCQVAVTKDRVKKLIANVDDGGGQNGVGYTQLTSIGYVREAEEEGGAHLPRSNMRVGFRVLNGHIANLGWPAGAAAYNAGAGNWQAVINTYGAEMSSKERAWAERLEKATKGEATKDEVPKPVSAPATGNGTPKEKTPLQLAEEAIELGTKLLGTPYGGGWKAGTWPEGPSLYARCDPKVHTVSFAKSHEMICFPGDTSVVAGDVRGASRRSYEGEVVTVETAGGRKLTGTPNHPILTSEGWLPLKALRQGHDVAACPDPGKLARGYPDDYGKPTPIAQVHQLLGEQGTGERCAGVPMDFHGDGRCGEVDVVAPESVLRDEVHSFIQEQLGHLAFSDADPRDVPLVALGPAVQDGVGIGAASGGVGRTHQGHFFFAAHPGVAQRGGAFAIPHRDAGLFEPCPDSNGGTPQPFGYNPVAVSGEVHADDGIGVEVEAAVGWPPVVLAPVELGGLGNGASGDAGIGEDFIDPAASDAETSRHLVDRLAAFVGFDKIARVERRLFKGHVYNLQTGMGVYLANGIIVHNCSAFVNFLRAHVAGLPAVGRAQGDGWPGGTAAFWRTFGRMKGTKPYPPVENTPRGWLVYSPYLGSPLAMQGHVGIALGDGKVLEARLPVLSNNRTEDEGHRALIAGGGQGYTTIIPPSIWLRV